MVGNCYLGKSIKIYLLEFHIPLPMLIISSSRLFILHAVPQAAAMGVVAYLFNSSSSFYMGTRYDLSFIFATISWCLSVVIAGILVLAAVLGPPEYAYESL
jgi:hypothetical protein